MRPFSYVRAADEKKALAEISQEGTQFVAGGTTLLDLMKLDVVQPHRLVDLNKLSCADVKENGAGVLIGALARNSDVAHNQIIKDRYPVLSQALLSGASAQLRNMATTAGNLMQRCRCPYFRDNTLPCNKREPGSGCPAIEGFSRMHAIFGGSKQCIAVHPSDMAVAMTALDAIVHVTSPTGERKIPLHSFYLLPEDHPEREVVLAPGELIVAVELPSSEFSHHSHYLKVRDRTSFSFALVSVAACLKIDGGKVKDARIVLGGVGTKPWRLEKSEKLLVGKQAVKERFHEAALAAIEEAEPAKYNKFKVELTKRSVERALEIAAGGTT